MPGSLGKEEKSVTCLSQGKKTLGEVRQVSLCAGGALREAVWDGYLGTQ